MAWLLPFVLLPLGFAAVSLLLAWIGGWARLARHYRAAARPAGRSFWMQSARFGWVDYSRCLTLRVAPEGLYLAIWPLFRAGHPPLLLPWSALHVEAVRDRWWGRDVTLTVGEPPLARLRLPLQIVAAAKELGQAPESSAASD